MKTFFYYFFRLRWLKAIISLFQDSERLELEQWIEKDYQISLVKCKGGVASKLLAKDLKALHKGVSITPLGLQLYEHGSEPTQSLDEVLEYITNRSSYLVRIVNKIPEDISETSDWKPFGNGLEVHSGMRWNTEDDDVNGKLTSFLTDGWIEMSRQTGAFPSKCSNCDNELDLQPDLLCADCGFDMELTGPSKDPYTVYKEITDYEQSSNRTILRRVAQ